MSLKLTDPSLRSVYLIKPAFTGFNKNQRSELIISDSHSLFRTESIGGVAAPVSRSKRVGK